MKIFTHTAHSSAKPEMQDKVRKTILLILFISLAITALADSVLIFSNASSVPLQIYVPADFNGIPQIAVK